MFSGKLFGAVAGATVLALSAGYRGHLAIVSVCLPLVAGVVFRQLVSRGNIAPTHLIAWLNLTLLLLLNYANASVCLKMNKSSDDKPKKPIGSKMNFWRPSATSFARRSTLFSDGRQWSATPITSRRR